MNNIKKIEEILVSIGIYIEEFNENNIVGDIILDSLDYISFYIEIEKIFNIEIPDEYYVIDISEMTFSEFIEKIISPLIIKGESL